MKTTLIIILLTVSGLFSGTVLYVNASATGNNNGKTWANAYVQLESALFAALPGQEIWVAKGTYYPTFDYGLGLGDRGKHFRLKNGVKVYGGFTGVELLVTERNFNTNICILSGDIGIAGVNTDNCYHVIYNPDQNPDIDNTAILDGFTIQDGYSTEFNGGGILNEHSSPVIKNCIITRCRALRGGGIYNYFSSPVLEICSINYNTASTGGGICNEETSDALISLCHVTDNHATADGGGIYNLLSSPAITSSNISVNSAVSYGGGIVNNLLAQEIKYCTVAGNTATFGGGVFNNFSQTYYKYCTVEMNSADTGGGMLNNSAETSMLSLTIAKNTARVGGGLCNMESSTITMENSLVCNNTASEKGGSSYNDHSNLTSTNCTTILKSGMKGKANVPSGPYSQSVSNLKDYACITWHDPADSIMVYIDPSCTMEMNYSCYDFQESEISGGGIITEGVFNIHTDPIFADPAGSDFRLTSASPCIDAGNDTYNAETEFDIRNVGFPRHISRTGEPGISDIGAYEYYYLYDPLVLLPPGNITIVRSEDITHLNWSPVTDAGSYNIFRSADPYTGYVLIGNTSGLYYADESALTDSKYFYYVTAVSGK